MAGIPESRSLTLNTFDITQTVIVQTVAQPSFANTIGSSNSRLTQVTWKNINLKRLLGDLYYTYRQFNLVTRVLSMGNCVDIGSNDTTVVPTDQMEDRNWVVFCGPSSSNPTFHWTHNYFINSALPLTIMPIATYSSSSVAAAEGFQQYYNDNLAATFDTFGPDIIDIQISICRAADNQLLVLNKDTTSAAGTTGLTSPTALPNWQLFFDIVPIVSSRINNSNDRP